MSSTKLAKIKQHLLAGYPLDKDTMRNIYRYSNGGDAIRKLRHEHGMNIGMTFVKTKNSRYAEYRINN